MALGLGLEGCRGMAAGKGEPAQGWGGGAVGGLAGRTAWTCSWGPRRR